MREKKKEREREREREEEGVHVNKANFNNIFICVALGSNTKERVKIPSRLKINPNDQLNRLCHQSMYTMLTYMAGD